METINNNITEQTVGGLVAEDHRKADVFKKYGIDFCCGGKKTVAKACADKNVNISLLLSDIAALDEKTQKEIEFKTLKTDALIHHIVSKHHEYLKINMPLIFEYSQKVAKAHGNAHPEVVEIFSLFGELKDELTNHLYKEENILFPYIQNLSEAYDNKLTVDTPPFKTVENPIHMMEQEHVDAHQLLDKIKKLSTEFTPPESACTTYKILYIKLKEFEDDLYQHIHLENNILFPRAVELEKIVTQQMHR